MSSAQGTKCCSSLALQWTESVLRASFPPSLVFLFPFSFGTCWLLNGNIPFQIFVLNVETEVQERVSQLLSWNELSNIFVRVFLRLEFCDGLLFFLSGLAAQPIQY